MEARRCERESQPKMKTLYKVLSWSVAIALVVCVPLFGWKLLLAQSKEATENPYDYDLERFRAVPADLLNYSECEPIIIEGESLHALATDADGFIYVSADTQILKMDPSGAVIKTATLDTPCYCMAAGTNATLYLGMEDRIEVWNTSLEKQQAWPQIGENSRLTSVAASSTHLYAADSGSRRVWKFTLAGKLESQVPREGTSAGDHHYIVPSPYFDVAVGRSVWIANPGKARVEHYGTDNKLRAQWGEPSMTIEGFSGCCNPSHIALIGSDTLVTAEKGLPRVKLFDFEGNLLSVVAGPKHFSSFAPGCTGEAIIKDIAVDTNNRVLILDRSVKAVRIFKKRDS
jgi:hypothetical protein